MKKKNGFIAVSLIYSFFLIFLMVMLASATKNTQTRQLLRAFKDDLQAQLNQEEFIKTTLENKAYNMNEEVTFVNDTWQVIKDNGNSVVLILKRSLNKEEITKALEVQPTNTTYFQNSCNDTSCKIKMCLSSFSHNTCYYQTTANYTYYTWENSVAKIIVDRWFEQNLNLQKACRLQYDEQKKERLCSKDTLVRMNFSDGIKNNLGYIRIVTRNEATGNIVSTNPDTWTLTVQNRANGISSVWALNNAIKNTHNTVASIRPVIEVRKS